VLVEEELQKKICDFLGILRYSVEHRGAIGLLDQNFILQSFIAKFLNIIYGYALIEKLLSKSRLPRRQERLRRL
jgi:hypothetical protein